MIERSSHLIEGSPVVESGVEGGSRKWVPSGVGHAVEVVLETTAMLAGQALQLSFDELGGSV